jgi:hypothetical protein
LRQADTTILLEQVSTKDRLQTDIVAICRHYASAADVKATTPVLAQWLKTDGLKGRSLMIHVGGELFR